MHWLLWPRWLRGWESPRQTRRPLWRIQQRLRLKSPRGRSAPTRWTMRQGLNSGCPPRHRDALAVVAALVERMGKPAANKASAFAHTAAIASEIAKGTERSDTLDYAPRAQFRLSPSWRSAAGGMQAREDGCCMDGEAEEKWNAARTGSGFKQASGQRAAIRSLDPGRRGLQTRIIAVRFSRPRGTRGTACPPLPGAQGVRGPGLFAAPDRRHAMLRRNRMLCFRLSSGSPGHQSCSTM
jgi:hypothetical protein